MSSWYDDCYDDNTGWVSSTVNDWDKGKYRNVMMKVVSQKSTNWYNAEEVCKKHCARLGRVADAYISFVGKFVHQRAWTADNDPDVIERMVSRGSRTPDSCPSVVNEEIQLFIPCTSLLDAVLCEKDAP
ncbi:hypothetical protein Q1695_012377 [Nippostrongylus brasiliensis]|nr:hypothetical protein Q1695_012377 [Nippostrongylus brasiliensis]